jgi:exonuclease SbcC
MRPIKLSLTAFGPFAQTQEIDFRQPLSTRLFGIYGATGAGKTSILDGICYALFGESSGDERQDGDLRSHHVSSEVETEVRLIFEIGEKRYHVVRRPTQKVQAKRGGGETERQHWAAVYDASDLNPDQISVDQPGSELAERKVRLVDEKLREILGYDAKQFRHVVLLPQGRFRELLTAKSDERSAVLRGLFDVALYERFVDRMKAEAGSLRDKVKAQRQRVTVLLGAQGLASMDELALAIGASKDRIEEAEVLRVQASAAQAAAREGLSREEASAAAFTEHDAAQQALEELSKEQPTIDILQRRIRVSESAKPCIALAGQADIAQTKLREVRRSREAADADYENKCKAADAAVEALNASHAKQSQRAAAAALVITLGRHKEVLADAEPLRMLARQAGEAQERASRALQEAAAKANKAREAAKLAAEALNHAHQDASVRASLELEFSRLSAEQARADHFAGLVTTLKGHEVAEQKAKDCAAAAREAKEAAANDLADAEQQWAEEQAARLAELLRDGEPCPVCGSAQHPKPAGHAIEGSTDKEALSDLRTRLEEADRMDRQRANALAACEALLTSAKAALAAVEEPSRGSDQVGADLAEAQEALQKLGPEPDVTVLREHAQSTAKAALCTEAELSPAQKAATEASIAYSEAEGQLKGAIESVPAELRDPAKLETAIAAAEADRDHLHHQHEKLVQAEQQAQTTMASAEATSLGWKRQEAQRMEEAEAAKQALTEALTEAGLDEMSFQQAKADLSIIDNLKQDVLKHAEALAAAKDRALRAGGAIAGLERPNLASAKAAYDKAEAAVAAAVAALTEAVSQQKLLVRLEGEVSAILQDVAADEERYSVVGGLSELSDGNNPLRIRLRDFAIAATFDAVVEAANLRLQPMSKGRFLLRRRTEGGDGRQRTGLDLEVFDTHTDLPREARTLSGGEGFLASLSLALGLSDVVQAEAGGVKLDAIFIDEGFGHLDDETLDTALETLRDLVGQNRAVGVISHVEAVKQQISAGFDVRRTTSGSIVVLRTAA